MELRTVAEAQLAAKGQDGGPSNLGSKDFLKLMTTQLRNQDPFSPMDQTAMLGQMAQFSTVTGITEMNASIGKLAESLYSAQMLNAASLIGKDALVEKNTATLQDGGEVRGQLDLPESTQAVTLEVLRGNGEVIRSINLGAKGAGPVDFAWDGKSNNGTAMPAGDYFIRAAYKSGEAVLATPTYLKAKINSVSIPAGGGSAQLNVEGIGQLGLSAIKALS